MPEPTDDQRRSAQEIVDRLIHVDEWLAQPVPVRVEALPSGLSILDLELHAAQFRAEIALLEVLRRDFPAMSLDEEYRVPVSLAVTFPYLFGPPLTVPPLAPRRHLLRYVDRYFHLFGPELDRILDELYERSNLVPLKLRDAQRIFVERASESLSHRVANAQGADEDPPDAATTISIPPTGGAAATLVAACRFTVSTNTSGLRVFWSGAYYITTGQYFGAPTTPAIGTLQSGTYVFGVDGGAYTSVQWDKTAICTLPGQPSVHLNF